MKRLNAQDEYFLDSDTPTAPTHVGGLEIYRLPPGAGRDYMQKLYTRLKNSPVRAEPFNYKLVTQQPEEQQAAARSDLDWLRPKPRKKPRPVRGWAIVDNVNVEDHVYLHALPRPGGQRELGELVSRLHVNRLDRSRPLWETHLIEGLEGGRYAVYNKLHHSQFDGKRGMSLARYTRSPRASKRGMPAIWSVEIDRAERSREPKATTAESASRLESLASLGKALASMRNARKNKPGEGVIAPYTAPQSILNGPLTARRRLGTQSLPIDRMKALGAAVEGGATVNEILLAVCGGALRRYLLDHKALPEQPLIAACPVAVPRKEAGAAGNAVGQILVSLGTHVANPKRRLLAVVASSKANKGLMREIEGEAYDYYTRLSMLPQLLVAKGRYGHKVLNANLVISNVPGPREPQYVNGALLESMYSASMLLAGQALNITVSSIGDNLDVGIMACPDLCPSPQNIAVYAGEELAILERAMGVRVPAKKAPLKLKKAPLKKSAVIRKVTRKAAANQPASRKRQAVR